MSDGGGGESSKEIESTLKKRKRKNVEFPQSIAKIAVAQVCESVGFQGFQQSALDTFSDVACKYIREIGKISNFYANLSGRTECNVFDIVQGLEDLSLSQGFLGASDRDHCLSGSGIIKELSQFVNLSEEIAFAYSVPSFPVIKERKLSQTFFQSGETPPTDIIPPWLPKFPDSKTYITILPSITEDNSNTRMIPDRIEQEQKVLDFEQPSSKLEQTSHVSEFPNNPFLAVPLPPGGKEVSLVTIPVKLKEEDELQNNISKTNHVSASDTVNENQRGDNNGCDNSEEGIRRKVLVNNRSAVKMKFQIPKKPLDSADVLEHNEKGKSEVVCWFMNDEKEKRMEKLMKEQDQEQEQDQDQDQDHEHQQMEIEGGNGNDSVVN